MRTSQKDAEIEQLLAQALVVCEKLIKLELVDDSDRLDWDLLTEATDLAREVVAQVEEKNNGQ